MQCCLPDHGGRDDRDVPFALRFGRTFPASLLQTLPPDRQTVARTFSLFSTCYSCLQPGSRLSPLWDFPLRPMGSHHRLPGHPYMPLVLPSATLPAPCLHAAHLLYLSPTPTLPVHFCPAAPLLSTLPAYYYLSIPNTRLPCIQTSSHLTYL